MEERGIRETEFVSIKKEEDFQNKELPDEEDYPNIFLKPEDVKVEITEGKY